MENKSQDLAPAPGLLGVGAGRSRAYNGPSVSLCFYSQIGSAGLKENRERWSTNATVLTRGRGTGEVQNWNSLLSRQVEWRQLTRNQEKWEILQNTECCFHVRQLIYPSSGWYWVFYKSQAASQRWGCFSWNGVYFTQNISEQGWGRALPGSPHNNSLWLGAPHGNNFFSVREITGGLDVKRMIKCSVLLNLEYTNNHRLQGARE